MSDAIAVRQETTADHRQIRTIHDSAFGASQEGRIVDAIRSAGCEQVSLVAELDNAVVGHILFSAILVDRSPDARLVGLGPMAVLPEFQRQGVGSALVREGLKQCGDRGIDAVVVLGHPQYYPRFGFVPASRYGIRSEYPAPDEAFMALALHPDALSGISGLVRYHDAFGAA